MPIANQEDNYGHLRYNGVLQLQNAMNWIWLGGRTRQHAPRDLLDWDRIYRRLPLVSAMDGIADRPFFREMVRHNEFDSFWSSLQHERPVRGSENAGLFRVGMVR